MWRRLCRSCRRCSHRETLLSQSQLHQESVPTFRCDIVNCFVFCSCTIVRKPTAKCTAWMALSLHLGSIVQGRVLPADMLRPCGPHPYSLRKHLTEGTAKPGVRSSHESMRIEGHAAGFCSHTQAYVPAPLAGVPPPQRRAVMQCSVSEPLWGCCRCSTATTSLHLITDAACQYVSPNSNLHLLQRGRCCRAIGEAIQGVSVCSGASRLGVPQLAHGVRQALVVGQLIVELR